MTGIQRAIRLVCNMSSSHCLVLFICTLVLELQICNAWLQKLREQIESGVGLGAPDGILINGFGPYRYDNAVVSDGIPYQILNVEPGDFSSFFLVILCIRHLYYFCLEGWHTTLS